MTITKTDFMTFRNCASDFWMKKHKPELFEDIQYSDFEKQLIEQGYEVERLAQKLFPEGIDAKLVNANHLSKLLHVQDSILFQPSI